MLLRKSQLALLTFCSSLLMSCSEEEKNPYLEEQTEKVRCNVEQTVTKNDALRISEMILNKKSKTRGTFEEPSINYVIKEKEMRTRNGNVSEDTLAYIVNYPDNKGFAIISSSRKVYPVLGFSTQGNFSTDNEIAQTNFVSNIAYYIESADESASYYVSEDDFEGCYSVEPIVQISLSQRAPWDKYVIQEHPGCPVGCVAVATALVMSHSKMMLSYHGSTYILNSMLQSIKKGPEASLDYEKAVDSMAKILYWIGKDISMEYTEKVSLAYSRDAYDLCCLLGLNIPSGYADFDINEVTKYLNDNHIVYLVGHDINGKGGHAWVSDGCYFCVDAFDQNKILDTYIHCDWGWGGNSNGYYSGSVFKASSYNFKVTKYFAVECEGQIISPILP